MSASDTLEAAIASHVFGLGAHTPLANYYIGLYTAAPSDAGGGTEVTIGSNAYIRGQVINDGTTWARVGSVVSNIIPITFAAPSPAAWGTVTHFGLHRAATTDVLDFWAALAVARATAIGQPLTFAAGDLTVTVD